MFEQKFEENFRAVLLVLTLTIFATINTYPQNIVINEIMTSNFKKDYDENYKTPDWIELYNPSNDTVNLKGYRISDNSSFENAWVFPDTVINPHSYLTLFASGENRHYSKTFVIESTGMPFYYSFDNDNFSFAYIPISGNFECTIEISSMINPTTYSQAIIMLRENLTNSSKYAGIVCQNPILASLYILQSRMKEKTIPKDIIFYNTKPDYPHCKFRLKRENDDIYGYVQTERFFWNVKNKIKFHTNKDTLYLGIGFASGTNERSAKLNIKHIILNNDTLPFDSLRFKSINTLHKGKMYYSNELHTNFKLSRKKDTLYLWDLKGTMIDYLHYNNQLTNVSLGRFPDGSSNFQYMPNPSFNSKNKSGFIGICKKPEYSIESSWHKNSIDISIINKEKDAEIYYTIDGSSPDTNSKKYANNLIHISKNTVIRAISTKSGYISSPINTNTYFINDSASIPVISFVTDSINLYGEKGIFNEKNYFNRRIEIPVNFEIFDRNHHLFFESTAGAKLSGQATVNLPQKSVRVYARNVYGNSSFNYPFFGNKGLGKYKTLIFRNGGNTWSYAFLRDVFSHVLSQQLPYSQVRAFQPAIMYINGEYYGIQNIRERLDAPYFHIKYKIPEDSINIIDDLIKLKNGISYNYFSTLNKIIEMDMSTSQAYEYLDSHIALNNFTDFFIMQLFVANTDWPWKNQQMWSSPSLDNKWRWNFTDMDFTLGINSWPSYNMFSRIVVDSFFHFPKIFLKVLENTTFKNRFLNRTADLYNTVFKPKNVLNIFDSLVTIIRPEISRHHTKYNNSVKNWKKNVSDIRGYIKARYRYFPKAFIDYFHLSGISRLTVRANVNNGIKIRINSITADTSFISGLYFNDVPVEIEVIGGDDDDFLGWSDKLLGTKRKISVTLSDSLNLLAVFKKESNDKPLVINEIMYKPADENDCKDWFEIYNPNDKAIDLSSYSVKDEKDEHNWTFPASSNIAANDYLVITADIKAFKNFYPDVQNVIGEFDFGFGKKDQIRLYNFTGRLVDSVVYSNKSPWPKNANGTGYSIELISYKLDNNKGDNWKCSSNVLGTPGKENSVIINVERTPRKSASTVSLYPNPCDKQCTFEFKSYNTSNAILSIYDTKGHLVSSPKYLNIYFGTNYIPINTQNFVSGTYVIVLNTNEQIYSTIMQIMR